MISEDKGAVFVMKSDLSRVFNRTETFCKPQDRIIWCANDIPLLVSEDSLIMIGPNKIQKLKLSHPDHGRMSQ